MTATTYAPGKYRAVIKDFGWTEASTGTPQFFIDFDVTGRYDKDGNLTACPRFLRTYYRAISTKGKEARAKCVNMLKADLSAIGEKVQDEAQLDPGTPGALNLLNKQIDAYCAVEAFNDKAVERWALRSNGREKLSVKGLRSKLGGRLFEEEDGPPPPAVPPGGTDATF
jgi:hypothetical protein